MDLATGEILSFSMSHKPNLSFVMESLHQVLPILKRAKYQTTIYSDQGWHYQHQKWESNQSTLQYVKSLSKINDRGHRV